MTLNRDIFVIDPLEGDIPNLGVAKVKTPEDESDWKTLTWELRSFVCEGEYERGLDRILDQYLSHLNQAQQPAAWVSGFFGSGKTHLMRVLEYLWRDFPMPVPPGGTARSLATLTPEITRHLTELSAAAKRVGGLWSAAGTLGAGAAGSVRLAFLSIVFDSAGLPQQLAPARLAIWLKSEEIYDAVQAAVVGAGKEFDHELRNLYVSPVLAEALIAAGATFGDTAAEVSAALQAQYPTVDDISNDEMLDTFEQVLKLQSEREGELPLTLVILDEMQQYINDDNEKALNVQDLVEGCSSRFGSQVLVVATGQAALTANPTLQKLIDRFSVSVALSDTDVETVVRKVVLRKKPDAIEELNAVLSKVSGEIDRELGGTKLEAKAEDKTTLVADYPLLPTRRRFWERALRSIDKAGKSGVLRTQLKIVHEAARSVADDPLGSVIGGDFVFRSESASMLQSGVLLKEIDELIRGLDDGTSDGDLKSRACALIFLISQLPQEGIGDTGLRATADFIADLMVEDLANDGARLRKDVPRLLDELVEQGRVMKIGEEFRLQTEEGAEWTKDFNQRRAAIRDDATKMSQLRNEQLLAMVDEELANLKLAQGDSKTPRKFARFWGDEEPVVNTTEIPLWIRDEWNISESKAREAAAAAGNESPIVFVLLPRVDAESIRDALANYAAAQETINQRPEPQTDEGRQAKRGMQSRVTEGQQRLAALFGNVISNARVFQGGGNELTAGSMREAVEMAGGHSLTRLFPKFKVADSANWGKVVASARDGAPDALKAVGWTEEVTKNPVCKEVLDRTPFGGCKGAEVQRALADPPYGWPKDAIDGALLVLLAAGNVRAERDGQKVDNPKALPATQIGKATFVKEDDPPSTVERVAVRGLIIAAKVPYTPDQEAASISGLMQHFYDLAARAGGSAPLPEPPDTSHLDELKVLAGNQQFRALAAQSERLKADLEAWGALSAQRAEREQRWHELDRLLVHAHPSNEVSEIRGHRDAIQSSRLLLTTPDPVAPLLSELSELLRSRVLTLAANLAAAVDQTRAGLESSEGWSQLDTEQQREVLAIAGVDSLPTPAVGSEAELLRSLDAQPLASYQDRIDALPAKAAAARKRITEILNPEPTVVAVPVPAATISTPDEASAFLEELRARIVERLDAGEIVVF